MKGASCRYVGQWKLNINLFIYSDESQILSDKVSNLSLIDKLDDCRSRLTALKYFRNTNQRREQISELY